MATKIELPQLGESVHEGTLGKWLKNVGDTVKLYEPIVEVSTDKVDTEMPSPVAGTLLQVLVKEGETVKAGTPIALIGDVGEQATAAAPVRERAGDSTTPPTTATPAATAPQAAGPAPDSRLRLSPVVARMLADYNLDPHVLKGSGEGGRITKLDVQAYLDQHEQPGPAIASAAVPESPFPSLQPEPLSPQPLATVPQAQAAGREETVPLSNMRRLIAEHMVRSRRTAAHVTAFAEVDMTRLVLLRERNKAAFEARNAVKLTFMPFMAMAAIRALRDFPTVNSVLTGDAIIVKHYVNLGIAVALDDGLIVPVIKNADEKNLQGLARAIADLAQRARERRLSPDDVQDGTFTITNPGAFGTILGTPIIHQPQAAILDMEAIVKRPVVVTSDGLDSIAIRSIMFLGLSFDHRIIDGAVAAQFLGRTKQYLEQAEFDL